MTRARLSLSSWSVLVSLGVLLGGLGLGCKQSGTFVILSF